MTLSRQPKSDRPVVGQRPCQECGGLVPVYGGRGQSSRWCESCRTERTRARDLRRYHADPARKMALNTESDRRLREAVLVAYGECCLHCGIEDQRVLQLDHVNGGGAAERRRLSRQSIYRRALRLPDEYQLLCANCNWIKRSDDRGPV